MATMIESNQTISYDSTTIQIENNTNKSFFSYQYGDLQSLYAQK